MKLTNSRQTGFTLLEVLISLVILMIGLLGLAGLQATGLVQNHSASLRSQATLLAYDMSDRMRSNIDTVDSYNTDTATPKDDSDCDTISGCTSVEMAENDLFDWNANLTSTLPSGEGTIIPSGSIYTITVNWDDNRDGSVDSDDPNFAMEFQP